MLSERERAAVRYALRLERAEGDARRMSSVLRQKFTPDERQELRALTNEPAYVAALDA